MLALLCCWLLVAVALLLTHAVLGCRDGLWVVAVVWLTFLVGSLVGLASAPALQRDLAASRRRRDEAAASGAGACAGEEVG